MYFVLYLKIRHPFFPLLCIFYYFDFYMECQIKCNLKMREVCLRTFKIKTVKGKQYGYRCL